MSSDTNCTTFSDSLWTCGNVMLGLIVLHLLREQCIPAVHQIELKLFFQHVIGNNEDNRSIPKPDCDAHQLTDDSCIVRVGKHEKRCRSISHEDEHFIILSKAINSPKPRKLLVFNCFTYDDDSKPSASEILSRYTAACVIYVLQLYIVYKIILHVQSMKKGDFWNRASLAMDLILCLVAMSASAVTFIGSLMPLREDGTAGSQRTRNLLLPELEWIVWGGLIGLLYFFVTSV